MRQSRFALVALCVVVGLNASAQNLQCPDITKTLKEYAIDSSSSSFLRSVFAEHCQIDGSRKSSGGSASLDVVVQSIPVGFKGDYKSAEESMSAFCKTYKDHYQGAQQADSYKETISTRALETIQQCLALQASGVTITSNVRNVEGADFFLKGSVNSILDVKGVAITGNVVCEGIANGKKRPFDASLDLAVKATAQFACKRTGTPAPSGGTSFGEATITVLTSQGNYSLFWPRDEKQSENMASAIDRRITTLEGDVSVAKGGLAPFVAATPVRLYKCPFGSDLKVDAAWASFGCNGQTTTEGYCLNTWYNKPTERRECGPIGTARLIQ